VKLIGRKGLWPTADLIASIKAERGGYNFCGSKIRDVQTTKGHFEAKIGQESKNNAQQQ
jgi:hypothetical protein